MQEEIKNQIVKKSITAKEGFSPDVKDKSLVNGVSVSGGASFGVGVVDLRDALVRKGLVSDEQFVRAQQIASMDNSRVVIILLRLGYVSENDMVELLSSITASDILQPQDFPENKVVIENVNPRFLKQSYILPLEETEHAIKIAVCDPTDDFILRALYIACRKTIDICVVKISDLEMLFNKLYDDGDNSYSNQDLDYLSDGQVDDEDVDLLKDMASEEPIIRTINNLINDAVSKGASDIHIQPKKDILLVRYRLDGVLYDQKSLPKYLTPALVSRVKIIADLNIAEQRLPQDGRIRMDIEGRKIDLRVSLLPDIHGERVVMRILDHAHSYLDFKKLGLSKEAQSDIKALLGRSNGMILVTGPTGSGKTTTLYAMLHEIDKPGLNIISAEDPVEYHLESVSQIQVYPKIGMTFSKVLRSILRQDPDVIMVGEIRDKETAEIAVQAALTGHLVLSTLHTNTAAGAVARLLDMGIDGYLLASALNGVISQRLVRRLCDICKTPVEKDSRLIQKLSKTHIKDKGVFYQPKGCDKCFHIGYRSRVAISEHIITSNKIKELILNKASTQTIHQQACVEGMVPLFLDGVSKAKSGLTSLDEIMKFANVRDVK